MHADDRRLRKVVDAMETKFIPTLQAGNLLSQIQGRLLLIDMAEIERINSCGVRDWVNWNNQIQALGIAVILLRCSPVVVAQANMVTNFAADAFIHSFYAPYVHPDTGEEQSVLLFTEEIRKTFPVSAPKIYNENGEELEFDTHLLENASFLRLKNLTVQYLLPKKICQATKFFEAVKVFGVARNLFTITKFTGYDPEPDINLVQFNYPNTRQFVFGVEVSF